MNGYVPYKVGYGQTFDAYASPSRPTGITPVGVAGPCMGEPVSRPCGWETATLGAYDRGEGNPDPYYPLPRMESMGSFYSDTGNPTLFRPMSAYANTGNPTEFRPMSENGGYSTPMNIGEGGMRPMGVWPLIAAGLGALAIVGGTWVAYKGVDNITTSPDVAGSISQPIVQTTSNLAQTALIIGGLYLVFRKDIQKILK